MHSKHFRNYFLPENATHITTHLVSSLLLVWNKTETNGLNYGIPTEQWRTSTKSPMLSIVSGKTLSEYKITAIKINMNLLLYSMTH